jgi:glycosyltransferase involved in cell wall biosynthesis
LLSSHGLDVGEYLIFVAGRIVPTKGAHLAIEAINNLPNCPPLLIVGDERQVPEYAASLRKMAGPRIRFQPLVQDPAVLFGLMEKAKALVFPSTVEAMSMVLLESAAVGVPIICSEIAENREVLQDTAAYFESGSAESLAKVLSSCLADPESLSQMGLRARARIVREYDWASITKQYAELYHQVAGSTNPHSIGQV